MAIGEAAAAHAAKKIVESAAPAAMSRISRKFAKSIDKIRVQFTKTFQGHLSASHHRAKWIKTVVSKDKPIDLLSIYVNLSLRNEEDETFRDKDLNICEKPTARFIVSGTGGAGKTILMKKLLLDAFDSNKGFIPLFVELRNLND